jgi:hypothetical protein
MSSAVNFTVENNVLIGNTSFIGAVGPNCSTAQTVPNPSAFVIDQSNVQSSTTQSDFQPISDGDGLTCVMPPNGGDFWPFGGNPEAGSQNNHSSSSSTSLSAGQKAGIAMGIISGIVIIAVGAWFIRRRTLQRSRRAASSLRKMEFLDRY